MEPFLEIANRLPEAMALVEADGGVRAENRAFVRQLGVSLTGRRLTDVAAQPDALHEWLRMASRNREFLIGSFRQRRSDGEGVPHRAETAVLRPASGGAPALLLLRLAPRPSSSRRFLELNERVAALGREIKRRQHTEDALRASRELLGVTLSSIGDAVVATNEESAVTFLNPVAEQITGFRQDEALGRPLSEVFRVVNEETRRPVQNPVARVLAEGVVSGLANHTLLITRDGSEIPIDDSAAPIRDRSGRMIGAILVFHDIVERKRLEHELRERASRLAEADRRKDEFLAMLGHELRNPLSPILNALEVLRLAEDHETTAWTREVMERQVRHMARLVDDLLDISRITRGTIRLNPEPTDLGAVVRRAVETVRPSLDSRRHELRLALPDRPVRLLGDPTRLEQVVTNLLQNAAKFTDPGGQIGVELEEGEESITLAVRDSGRGIAPDALPAVFDLFAQADPSLERSQGGLGLGLTLVQRIAELHGGSARAHSRGRDQGSEFTVHLPRRLGSGNAATEGPTSPAVPAGAQQVLVVDDHRDSAASMSALLRWMGHRVAVAYDGAEALVRAREFRPDAVLLDIGLPGLDGYAVAEQLRAEAGGDVLLVAMTGCGHPEDRRRSRSAGFDDHLVKPVGRADLERLLGRAALPASAGGGQEPF